MSPTAPSTSKAALKGAPAASKKKKGPGSTVGAPAQRAQSSRKGKRAWRKNVDLDEVEEALEGLRAEERITGSKLHEQTNEQLFAVDTTGDEHVRRRQTKFSPRALTSAKILAQRSAVPAVLSRTTPTPKDAAGKRKLSHADKDRLLRLGKRARRGPLNSFVDESEFGQGSALLEVSAAARTGGAYDVWAADAVPADAHVPEEARKPALKAPKLPEPRKHIALAPVTAPHGGASYNPTVDAHAALLRAANDAEAQRLAKADPYAGIKAKMDRAAAPPLVPGVPAGMAVGDGEDMDVDAEPAEDADTPAPRRVPARKTKQQRDKAARVLAEKRALLQKTANRRMLASVMTAKSLRTSALRARAARAKEQADRDARAQEKLAAGFAGQRLGRHKVPTGEIDVQLGEDLSESLRALKPEGNVFRDRMLSLQQRGLMETRALVVGRTRQPRMKEYEKHAWKRFE